MTTNALHCRGNGTGPDLVMLHGWALHAGVWAPLAERLAPSFRLHMYDLPGHGESAPLADFTLDTVCAVLAKQAPAHADWLGWSLGGLIALEFAARYPARVRRLVLMATNPRFVATADWPDAMPAAVLEGFAKDLAGDYRATLNRFVSLIARGAPDTQVLRTLRAALADARAPEPRALDGGLAILRQADLRERLATLSMPVLLIGGARDTLVRIDALRQIVRRHPAIRLQEYAQAGHAPFVSHADAVARTIGEFLA